MWALGCVGHGDYGTVGKCPLRRVLAYRQEISANRVSFDAVELVDSHCEDSKTKFSTIAAVRLSICINVARDSQPQRRRPKNKGSRIHESPPPLITYKSKKCRDPLGILCLQKNQQTYRKRRFLFSHWAEESARLLARTYISCGNFLVKVLK